MSETKSFEEAFDNLRTCVDGVACWSGISSWCKKQRNCTECESNVNSHMEALYDAHSHDTTEHRDASAKLTILQRALSRDYGIDVKWDGLRHTWTIETDTTRHKDELRSEYHHGYVDAMRARATETWQLDQERMEIVRGLREFRCEDIEPWFEMQFWTLLRLLGVESDASTPADCDDVAHLRDRLIHLLGGDSNLSESPNPINKDAESESYLIESADFNKLDDRETVVRKLQALRFDGGSHENLSKIAYAIYPCATGWTCESCDGLRDSLVRLIGGDDGGRGVSGDVCRRSCADGCAGDSGEQTKVSDGPTDDSGSDVDSGYRGVPIHMDGLTTYDVLGNERQKAVCELRELSERGNVWGRELIVALGLSVNATNDDMCDRLIHLLSGDQHSGIDVLREMDAESDTDGTCPNDGPTSSITDELREWASDRHCKGISHTDVLNIGLIADRIDEQFDRICKQQEAVLQETIVKELFPGYPYDEVTYPEGETFMVEHDFRNTESDGIHVGCPDGSWIALTGEQFADMFGSDALARLDAIRYEDGDE